MNSELPISDKNAETIGRPILQQVIRLFLKADYEQFIQSYPGLRKPWTLERFNEATENLKPRSELKSMEFLARLNKVESHLLVWKVQYKKDDKHHLCFLALSDGDSEQKVMGFYPGDFKRVQVKSDLGDAEVITAKSAINDKNAETIGRPILQKVIRSFSNSDRDQLIQSFPELRQWMTLELFDEAARNLKPMGEMKSIEQLARLSNTDHNVLAWKVQYEKEDEDLLWKLHLSDDEGEIKVRGFDFDR